MENTLTHIHTQHYTDNFRNLTWLGSITELKVLVLNTETCDVERMCDS